MQDNKIIAAEIVSAYVSNNPIPASELPGLIRSVTEALDNLGKVEEPSTPAPKVEPAVSTRKSLTPDFIICLEDGKKFRSMKRHLATAYSMTPDQYRAKWGLPKDYPMVAQAFSQARSEMSKALGLGRRPVTEPVEASSTSELVGSTVEDKPMAGEPVEAAETVQEAA